MAKTVSPLERRRNSRQKVPGAMALGTNTLALVFPGAWLGPLLASKEGLKVVLCRLHRSLWIAKSIQRSFKIHPITVTAQAVRHKF